MAIPTPPGAGGLFQTLAPIFDKGYSPLLRTILNRPKVQPIVPLEFSDPRGYLGGLVPANTFSYEIFEEVTESVFISPNNVLIGSLTGLASPLSLLSVGQFTGEVATSSITKNCVVAFEGHDVVDFPTKDLPGPGLTCPTNVFAPIYAGGRFINMLKTKKLGAITQTDDLATKSALEYNKKSSGNGIKGMIPSDDLPLDSIFNTNGIFTQNLRADDPYLIDASSNQIDGSGEFVTYTAVDKPIFRDVITSNSAASAQGVFVGNSFIASFVGPYYALNSVAFGTPPPPSHTLYVIRYAMVNVGTPKTTKYRWRMSESFGIDPKNKPIDPPGALYNKSTQNAINAAEVAKHYAYDVNEPGDEIANDFARSTPLKQAYNPTHALAMMDQNSPFYRPNFKASVVPLKSGSEVNFSNLSIKGIYPNYRNVATDQYKAYMNLDGITQWRTFESAIHQGPFGRNLRVGLEYAIHRNHASQSLTASQHRGQITLLASTRPSTQGIGAYYDPCIDAIITVGTDGGSPTQRVFDDGGWTNVAFVPPKTGDTKAFMLGETPLRTSGFNCCFPKQEKKDGVSADGGSKGKIKTSSKFIVTSLIVKLPDTVDPAKPPILQLLGGTGGPFFEAALPSRGERGAPTITIQIPPFNVAEFNIIDAGGATLEGVLAADKTPFLPKLKEVKFDDDVDKLSKTQITEIDSLDFPLTAGSATVCALNEFGNAFFAFAANQGISLAFRHSYSRPFFVARDAVLRLPNDLKVVTSSGPGKDTKTQRPDATDPFLMADPGTDMAHLLYLYKSRIVCKNIPYEIFTNLKSTDFDVGFYKPDAEASIISKLHKLGGVICYDGYVKERKKDIQSDINTGFITLNENEVSPDELKTDTPSISNFTACIGYAGNYLFAQDSGRIIARKSVDKNKTWTDIFPQKTRFLPIDPDASTSTAAKNDDPDGTFPTCFFDSSTQTVFLFMFVESSLVFIRIPENMFLLPPQKAKDNLTKLSVEVVFGEISLEMKKRGIVNTPSVEERKKDKKDQTPPNEDKETITPQRVALVRTEFGNLRLFYADDKLFLHSLISTDGGRTWLSEEQFVKKFSSKVS